MVKLLYCVYTDICFTALNNGGIIKVIYMLISGELRKTVGDRHFSSLDTLHLTCLRISCSLNDTFIRVYTCIIKFSSKSVQQKTFSIKTKIGIQDLVSAVSRRCHKHTTS